MLWRAFWSIRCVNHIRDVVHHQQNPSGPVKVAVAMLEFHMNQIFEQIVQMRDALNGINDINMHALQLGHELAEILHPFPDQMHWISDAAENIHRSGDRIHSGLLVCIENQIFGPAQTRIQFGLAQLHLALANVLLATQFYADLPPAAVIFPEFQIQANVFDNEQGNDNGQGNEGDAVGHE
uniref:uncharacterized protein LOC105352109 isoform X1 n=1 Tax=Fragaria vesca subsp. vesca TaxID=101020 RepID=UPI0005CAB25A|nr:PREDICTED: uncharacterized protein LOC105352109 isoform X1 [Fragaria vesca subsp. vesca]